jgi:hypothetical protein
MKPLFFHWLSVSLHTPTLYWGIGKCDIPNAYFSWLVLSTRAMFQGDVPIFDCVFGCHTPKRLCCSYRWYSESVIGILMRRAIEAVVAFDGGRCCACSFGYDIVLTGSQLHRDWASRICCSFARMRICDIDHKHMMLNVNRACHEAERDDHVASYDIITQQPHIQRL